MKKLIIISALLIAGCSIEQDSTEEKYYIEPDSISYIGTFTYDMKIYEFTPKSNPEMQCVFVSGFKKGGLSCFEKQ